MRIAALLLALALAFPADASFLINPYRAGGAGPPPPVGTTQTLVAAATGAVSATADSYLPLDRVGTSVTSTEKLTTIPISGTLKSFTAWVNGTNPAGAATWTITLMRNDSEVAGYECAITSATSGTCAFTGDQAFSPGDWGSWRIRPSATAPTTARIQIESVFQSPDGTILTSWATAAGFSNSASPGQSQTINSAGSPGVPSVRRYPPFAISGTVDQMWVRANAPGTAASGKQYTYTVNKNGSTAGSPPSAVMLDLETSASDTVNSHTVTGSSGSTAGDDIQIQGTPANTPNAAVAGMGLRFVADAPCTGCFLFGQGATANLNTTDTNYLGLSGSQAAITTESQVQARMKAGTTFKKIAVKLGVAPGTAASGKKRNFFLRINETSTGLTTECLETATACEFSADIATSDDDRVDVMQVPTGAPAASGAYFSIAAVRP